MTTKALKAAAGKNAPCIKCQSLCMELDLMKSEREQIAKMLEAMEKTGGEVDEGTWSSAKERNLVLRVMNQFALNLLKSL